MDNQNQIPPQPTTPQVPTSETPLVSSESKLTGQIWKIAGVIFMLVLAIVSFFFWRGSRVEKSSQNLINNSQKNNMTTLTAEKISTLKVALNVGNDYFIGSPEEQNGIVDMFVKDNSASDSVYLYFAANTAKLQNRPKDAMFLFYAAQLRKSFDLERFVFDEANGNNIQTYLGYLNQGAGQGINPLAIQNPKLFSEAVRMIEKWNIVPAENAYYPKESYGEAKLAKEKWQVVAQKQKDSFLKDFAYKQEKILNDPKGLEAIRYIQDYNFGTIPNNSVNKQKYEEYLKIYKALTQ